MRRAKTISSDTKALLKEGEGERVDFKRSPAGISSDDLVAFANTAGGTILAGVDEKADNDGAQIGTVVGCDVSDGAILQVTNKAQSCIPPVAIAVSIETLDEKPFLRISVAASSTKPHCTPKGVYCRREGSRNRPLHPSELLQIFLASEARAFAEKFETAADRITNDLGQLEASLDRSIRSMADQLGWADFKLDDTESELSSIRAYVHRIDSETTDVATRLRALFRQDKRDDPIVQREKAKLRDKIVKQLLGDESLQKSILSGGSVSISTEGKPAQELTKDDLSAAYDEALKVIKEEIERRKYSLAIKKSADCSKAELTAAANLIKEGGEVASGIERRLKTADVIGLVRYEKEIVGTGSLKKPVLAYRNSVFDKSKAKAPATEFTRELGWLFVRETHRGKGQTRPLVEGLLDAAKTKGVFATTRVSNDKMQRILKHQGFRPDGENYPSAEHPGEEIMVFIRSGKTSKAKAKPEGQP